MTQGAAASDHEDHGAAHLAGEVNSKGLTKSRGRLSASQHSLWVRQEESQSLGAPLGSYPTTFLTLSFSAPALGRQWSDLLMESSQAVRSVLEKKIENLGWPSFHHNVNANLLWPRYPADLYFVSMAPGLGGPCLLIRLQHLPLGLASTGAQILVPD